IRGAEEALELFDDALSHAGDSATKCLLELGRERGWLPRLRLRVAGKVDVILDAERPQFRRLASFAGAHALIHVAVEVGDGDDTIPVAVSIPRPQPLHEGAGESGGLRTPCHLLPPPGVLEFGGRGKDGPPVSVHPLLELAAWIPS